VATAPKHHCQATDVVFERDTLADQLLARHDQRPHGMRGQRLHVHGLEESGSGQLCQAPCIIAVGLVRRQRLQRQVGLPTLDADDRNSERRQTMVEHRRHATCLKRHPSDAGAAANAAVIASGDEGADHTAVVI
jgi:hypothetical protein